MGSLLRFGYFLFRFDVLGVALECLCGVVCCFCNGLILLIVLLCFAPGYIAGCLIVCCGCFVVVRWLLRLWVLFAVLMFFVVVCIIV